MPPVLVLVLMAVSGVIQAVDLPARLAFVPDLVPKEDLINAVGLNSLLFNSARALGPALAALLFLARGCGASASSGRNERRHARRGRLLRAQRGEFPRGAHRALGNRGPRRAAE